ncbi:hypothetical protein SLS62_000229 [Diatrype stigma]|uniref:Aminoacyl-transfer RNA synthetases class-II family profile domain-containing protein n=1 Tax=Diatrype stigma TaxID=117547 RepID=A0AAN9YUV8_9PEZI
MGRKYRDEMRPRHGMLRSREFIMKDLYTFDYSNQHALSTYEEVRAAYSRLFDELKLPYLVAEASSGDIGGDLSHEYHLPIPAGEDNVISCNTCEYVANEELAVSRLNDSCQSDAVSQDRGPVENDRQTARVWRGVSKDRSTLINVWYPSSSHAPNGQEASELSDADLNTHAIKSILPELDSSLSDSIPFWRTTPQSQESGRPKQIVNVIDHRLGKSFSGTLNANKSQFPLVPRQSDLDLSAISCQYIDSLSDGSPVDIIRIRDGDACPRCSSGSLRVQKAVELGHTFHLGTRYSVPLNAHVQIPAALAGDNVDASSDKKLVAVPIQMGCHGIGVSRIISAVANHLADKTGLNWPRAIAPFEVVVVPGKGFEEDAAAVAKSIAETCPGLNSTSTQPIDIALDDRPESLPWRMKDADLVGYPVTIILGRKWESERLCEVQCRRLSTNSYIPLGDLPVYIDQLLSQL